MRCTSQSDVNFSCLRRVLQTKIKFSTEALAAVKNGGNARALRTAAKRREALATGYPYTVTTIGFCDTFVYCKGVLCYTVDDTIRILKLHQSAEDELVISIPGLLTHSVPDIDDHSTGIFQCLYYSNGILSSLYKATSPDEPAWLLAVHLKTRTILVAHELDSTDKIFVRHNSNCLYYGTHSEVGTDGYKKWVIHGFEFETRKWYEEKIYLPDMVGSEIGSTICFELYKGYFYALSNQTSFEVEEIDWTSFYHCSRFPLDSPCKALLQKTRNENMWRRQHQEGPIDDRWTSLRLDEDESTGELNIIEARKEWYLGASKSQRTYYTTDIIFPEPVKEDLDLSILPGANSLDSNFQVPTNSSWVAADTSDVSIYTSSLPSATVPTASNSSSTSAATISTTAASEPEPDETNISTHPQTQLSRLLTKDDHYNHINAPDRIPERTHPGNDGSQQPTPTLAKCRIRTYHTSCSTYLDLVDDPLPEDWQGKQRLRFRAGTRKLGPPLLDTKCLIRKPDPDLNIALREMYHVPPITYWPPAQNPSDPDEHIDAIYRLLNPPTHLGEADGIFDERSMVYATGRRDRPRALIFVGFDPSIRLAGVKQWGGLCKKGKGVGEGPHVDGRAAGYDDGCASDVGWQLEGGVYVDVGEADRTVGIDRKGKGKEKVGSAVHVSVGHSTVRDGECPASSGKARVLGHSDWAWRERAMYQDINLGMYFGLDKPERKKNGEGERI